MTNKERTQFCTKKCSRATSDYDTLNEMRTVRLQQCRVDGIGEEWRLQQKLLQWVSQHGETVDRNLTHSKIFHRSATSVCKLFCNLDRHAQSYTCASYTKPQQQIMCRLTRAGI